MQSATSPILRPDLGSSLPELIERVERAHGRNRIHVVAQPGLSVGECDTFICKPFGGSNKAAAGKQGMSVGQTRSNGSQATTIMAILEMLGATACRPWGAEQPTMNCKDLCGAIYPYQESVPAGATSHRYEMYAKKWYRPVFWVDTSDADVSVVDLEYTEDPVFENGRGSGALDVSNLLAPDAFYGFVPGLPAFDNKVPLVAILANSNTTTPEPFQGMFIGISARN